MGRLGLAVAAVATVQHNTQHIEHNADPHKNTHRGFGLVQGGLAHLPATVRPKPTPGRLTPAAGKLTLVRAMAQSGHFDSPSETAAQYDLQPAAPPEPARDASPAIDPAPLTVYRPYTESLLRRYLKLSMEIGRVPSLLGQEFFRARITSYRVHTFEDRVIFVLDMERCLESLNKSQRAVVARVALQAYNYREAAELIGWCRTTTQRRYETAIDRLTTLLLERKLLDALMPSQGGRLVAP